ncbi:AGE family epimerase/isomerase [Sphingomonas sp.]|uniref:AGE family epimerase/isomerase n=1 Tax=Sphingomonas sp. TaxID=28214 RepID=UPI0035C79456
MAREPLATIDPAPTAGEGTALQRLASWLCSTALPAWRADREPLPFAECRDAHGRRADPGAVRLRVTTRQTAVYAQAAMLGIMPAADALTGWRALTAVFWRPGHGWITRVDHRGTAVDDSFGLYDQAFALYACAHIAPLDPSGRALDLARDTLELIDDRLRQGTGAGWISVAGATERDQNSHLHFLEALLALDVVEHDAAWAGRIAELVALSGDRLFDPAIGAIAEHFDAGWRPLPQTHVEPGHQYEWHWLLATAQARGYHSALPSAQLFRFADRHGWSYPIALIHDRCDGRGRAISDTHRLWPHCEAIRAAAVQPPAQGLMLAARAAGRLVDTFCGVPFPGGWHDRVDATGRPIVDRVPATSLYHLWEAVVAACGAGWVTMPAVRPC